MREYCGAALLAESMSTSPQLLLLLRMEELTVSDLKEQKVRWRHGTERAASTTQYNIKVYIKLTPLKIYIAK